MIVQFRTARLYGVGTASLYRPRSASSGDLSRSRSSHCNYRSTAVARDVVLQLFDCELLLRDNIFHQVANGDQTNQLAIIHNGQVAQPGFRHQRHAVVARLVRFHVHDLR